MRGIFGQGYADRVAESIAQQGADADGGFDAAILAFAGLGDAEVNRIVPVRTQFIQPRDEQPVALDHHLGIGRLHGELEVVKVVFAADAGKFQRALDHAERCVAVTVHDAVAQRTVVGADPQATLESLGLDDKGGEFFLDPSQFGGVLFVVVFLDGKFLGIGIVAGIHADDFHPLHGFHGGFGLEMDVRDNRHLATLPAQLGNDVLQIRRVLHGGCGDANELAAHGDEFQRLLHT